MMVSMSESNKKNRVLIVCSNLGIGGFQRSLVSLLNCIDYERYQIDLCLFSRGGVFEKYIPEQVTFLNNIIPSGYYDRFPRCIFRLIRDRKFSFALYRMLGIVCSMFDKGNGFVIANKHLPIIDGDYDVVVDYNGQQLLYYICDKINAKRKITFFHSDYSKWDKYYKTDKKYFNAVDAIVTVSDLCVKSMLSYFPEQKNKIFKIENIISPRTVVYDDSDQTFDDGFEGIRLITVARICLGKGIDLAEKATEILEEKGYCFRWYWIGPTYSDAKGIYNRIIKNEKSSIRFIPPVSNPYRFMHDADILVSPTRFEGKSVTIEEAKVLNIPVVTTNYSTVYDQIVDGETGLITDMNPDSIAKGIMKLIDEEELYDHIKETQKKTCLGNEYEARKLEMIIDGSSI